MPVFDLYAFGKGLARLAVYLGLILFVISSIYILVSIGESLVNLLNNAVSSVGDSFNTPADDKVLSCMYYFFNLLGLDVFITSALSSVIGLGLIWAGFVIQITVMKFTFNMKKLLANGLQ